MKPNVRLVTWLAAIAFLGCSARPQLDALDHSRADGDVEITRRIRQTLLEPNDLSIGAKNVTIVTNNGQVTLLGVVASDAERREIFSIARQVAGSGRVREDLEIWPE